VSIKKVVDLPLEEDPLEEIPIDDFEHVVMEGEDSLHPDLRTPSNILSFREHEDPLS